MLKIKMTITHAKVIKASALLLLSYLSIAASISSITVI
jgi:hypothetical protein